MDEQRWDRASGEQIMQDILDAVRGGGPVPEALVCRCCGVAVMERPVIRAKGQRACSIRCVSHLLTDTIHR